MFSKSSYLGAIINFIAGELDTCFLNSEIKDGDKSFTYTSTRLNVSLKEHRDNFFLMGFSAFFSDTINSETSFVAFSNSL